MKLFLKLVRDIKQSIGQFIAFVLVIAVGAFFYGGLVTYSNNLSTYTEGYFKEHNVSDLHVFYKQISKNDVAALSEIEGIKKIEGRYTFDATQAFEDDQAFLKIHSIPVKNEINTIAMIEGRIPSRKNEIVVDSRYAKEHLFQVGDEISIRANERNFTFTISGFGENVEHAKKNEIQDHKTYGVAYIAEETISEILGGTSYNEIMIDATEGYDMDKLGQSIEAQSKSLPYVNQVSKERTFSYSKIKETIHNNKLMSMVIPFVLFLIVAIILFLTMSRMIDSQRNQVGIMKALGVKNRTIMLHYMGYPVLAGIIGSIIGCAIAALVFVPFVTASSARAYSLPGITYSLSFYSFIPPIIFSSAFGILACYLSGRTLLKERAAQAMRPKPPKQMKTLLIERIPGIWSHLSYSYKLILRNIFLNKPKAIASSIGVVVSTVLLITAFGTQSALQQVASQIEDVYTYDLRVDYTIGTSTDTVKLPSVMKNRYSLSTFPVEFIKGDEKDNATLVVTERENSLIHFFDENDNRITLENNGVLIPKSYADKYHISAGDIIHTTFKAPELTNKSVDMKVLHISTQYSNPSFYITPDYLKSFGIDYSPTSLLVEANSSVDLNSVRTFFEQDPQVETIADRDDLKKTAEYILKQNSFVFIMFIVCAVILSFGAIYTISSINIYERNRELATLKVLGYQKHKINRLIFFENILLTTFAVIVALPISGYVYAMIVKALSSTHQQIPDQLHISILLVSVILAYLLTILSNLLLRRKVTNLNMIESLKSVE
ncbi:ABC transporter permease [Brevibacillus porteri]|uniref:ABC transporter permease n=1 Tax=Brevibacillus porteri TaxID=2126350 RepID=A0ABX5FPM6_9BACL|nr:FtsX-like permease family protein [Brevibacillus porteri]MED1803090.1 FtsX-like permease family protein [Brevibacillus porteri]MED2135311.1 FtsX-like permease family protein [Brevibacillus porteri]MED2748581.1 FtsX-like permease family protein [Brevibacillus porteri]MED2818249.1 FtsX-like permease family protein [Brevibacillus porteri]MED2898025.1 FtsX-like permease family protein [Brevibacillus porteri]